MGSSILAGAILICLFALALLALAKPIRLLLRFFLSAALGGFALFLGKSLGAAVGLNAATLLVSGLLGLPGAVGLLLLSILL